MRLKAHWGYLKYVLRHKWFVFVAGRKTGAPLWRLLIHDWSKFTRAEWTPYVHSFYRKDLRGSPAVSDAFDRAWLHHQHVNKHHWQHWLLQEDDGDVKCLPMPEKYIREMVADWMGAGRAITGKWDITEWYGKNYGKIRLEHHTRNWVNHLISTVKL